MAAEISVAANSRCFLFGRNSFLCPKPTISILTPTSSLFSPSVTRLDAILRYRRKPRLTVCFVVGGGKVNRIENRGEESSDEIEKQISTARVEEKIARKKSERFTYLIAAVMSTFGITSMAVMAVYSRFSWQMEVYIFHLSHCLISFSL